MGRWPGWLGAWRLGPWRLGPWRLGARLVGRPAVLRTALRRRRRLSVWLALLRVALLRLGLSVRLGVPVRLGLSVGLGFSVSLRGLRLSAVRPAGAELPAAWSAGVGARS